MGEPIVLEDLKERVILVGVSEQDGDDAEDSLAELAELVKTAGASVAGTLIQKRELIHPGTYVGTGKVAEIAADKRKKLTSINTNKKEISSHTDQSI